MSYFEDVLHLLFPKLCITCDTKLLFNENLICTLCRHDLPIICYTDFKKNKVVNSFSGKIPIDMGASFLLYQKEGKGKKIIQQLKYKGNQEVGELMGKWFGRILKESDQFNEIDLIIPVPLHPKKLKVRGYNQLTTFGLNLAKTLQTVYFPNVLIRVSSTKTQTIKQRFDRFNNVKTTFKLTEKHHFKDKHVLLIDDVITTGATIEACCKELLKSDLTKISIVTIACTE